jgi:hypothetical protein
MRLALVGHTLLLFRHWLDMNGCSYGLPPIGKLTLGRIPQDGACGRRSIDFAASFADFTPP